MAAATAVAPLPPSGLRFADSFWDTDDRGVEVVLEKLRNSKQTCEEIKKLYEIRSQIEEDYGERLLKLSQLIVGQAEEGTLSESLSHIPSALETTARAHLDLSQQLKYHLEAPLDGFLREQRDLRRLHHQQIENARQLKNMHHTNAIKAKEFYTAECTKVAGMEKYLRERGSEMLEDEVQQVKEEIDEGKKMANAAEQEYRRAIEVLGSVTADWINSWKTTCDIFQDLEEKRIHYVNGSLRSFSSMMSSVYIVDDQCCERIRTTLELTDSRADIDEFIMRYGTGKEIPAALQFEPFATMDIRSGQITPASSHQDMQSVVANPDVKALPSQPSDDEELKSVDRQLHDLSVRRASRADENQDTVMTEIQQLEEMLSVDDKKSADVADEQPVVVAGQKPAAEEKPRAVVEAKPAADEKPVVEAKPVVDEKPVVEQTPVAQVKPDAKPAVDEKPSAEEEKTRQAEATATTAQANESASVSPDEPAVPATPPAQAPIPAEPAKDREEQRSTAPAIVLPAEDKERPASELSIPLSSKSDIRYKPMPNPNFKGTESSETNIPRVDSGSDLNVKLDEKDPVTLKDDGSESEKEYPMPPPKAEKWVISSIRRPQQLPVRAQNARMSMFATPPSTAMAPAPEPEPQASLSTGNKFRRPNAPFKIEIPNKSSPSLPQANPAHQAPQAAAQQVQAAAQQVIAAGRAHAHQTSSWQSPVNSSPNRRYSSVDRYQADRPLPSDPVNATAAYEEDLHVGRDDEPKTDPTSVGKKNNISSFMKGFVKHDSSNSSRPNSEKSNYNKASLQPVATSSTDKPAKENKRFSMNIFKKEKKHHKQAEDPIYEDVIVSAAEEQPVYSRPLSAAAMTTPMSRPSSALSGRPMSMAYGASASASTPQQQQQQQQPPPQQQKQPAGWRDRLEDGTPVIEYVRAIWPYDAKIQTEMSFMAEDVFAVLHKQMDNWWHVELMDPQRRQRGLVPGNYMENLNSM